MKKIKFISCIIFATVLVAAFGMTAFAATKKAIKSVNITAVGKVYAGDMDGDEEMSFTTTGTTYTVDSWTFDNEAFAWEGGETPVATVYLNAKDGYTFAITKASQITLKKCTYKTAARQNSSSTLAVTVTLDSVGLKIDQVDEAYITEAGVCSWMPVDNAGSYEVRFMRDTAILGGTQVVQAVPENETQVIYCDNTFTGYKFDGASYLTKEGTYHFKVRAIHKSDAKVKGEWTESPQITISDAKAKEYRAAAIAAASAGEWIQDSKGWRFKLPDGTFPAGQWKEIYQKWYYFKADSYAATGWQQIDGAWYYFDPTQCYMWLNTKTPDGYELSIDGRRVEGKKF